LLVGSLAAAFLPCASGAIIFSVTGTYDSTAQANAVETDATGNLTPFSAAVSAAFTAGTGGVITFDGATYSADTVLTFNYASGTKALNITSAPNQSVVTVTGTGTVTPISGSNVLTRPDLTTADTTFTIGSITGGAADERVVSFGFTILSRTSYPAGGRDFTVTANYSDGSNSGGFTSNIGNTKGGDDTFWGFTAPTGLYITSVVVDAVSNGTTTAFQPVFDDIAFITAIVPEPGSGFLVGAGALVWLGSRRRGLRSRI
jgi:hypothetical protein